MMSRSNMVESEASLLGDRHAVGKTSTRLVDKIAFGAAMPKETTSPNAFVKCDSHSKSYEWYHVLDSVYHAELPN